MCFDLPLLAFINIRAIQSNKSALHIDISSIIIASVFTIPAALLEMWWLIIVGFVIGVVCGVKYSIDVPLSPEATKLIERVKEIKNVE